MFYICSQCWLSLPPALPSFLRLARPPACLVAARLQEPPEGARITAAGLVILRQRPGTAKGVISARLLRVTGRLQRAHSVTHVIAEEIEDISPMLDLLLRESG